MEPLTTAQLIQAVRARRTDEIVVATMTALVAWSAEPWSVWDLPVVGAMGSASSIGLGLALAQPERRVWVLDGDGSLLMQLGTLATIGAVAPRNLVHLVNANGVYAYTGGQALPQVPQADLAAVAAALGYRRTATLREAGELERELAGLLAAEGPVFVACVVRPPAEKSFKIPSARPMADQGQALRARLRAQPD